MYKFTDDIRLGIKEIDEEHEGLFALIEEAQNMLNESDIDVRIVATEVVKRLRDYAETHFAHEEAYMRQLGGISEGGACCLCGEDEFGGD